jgi:hypothetical protein
MESLGDYQTSNQEIHMCDSNPNKVPQTEQKLRDNVKASEKQHIKASEQKQALGHHQGKRTRR